MSEVATSLVGALAVAGLFVWFVRLFKLVTFAQEAIALSRRAASIVRDAALDDDAKEVAIQQSALRLLKLTLLLLVGSVVAVAAPMAAIWLLDLVGLMSLDSVVAILLRWDFLLLATVLGIGGYVLLERRRR
jgi:hypothetical protein